MTSNEQLKVLIPETAFSSTEKLINETLNEAATKIRQLIIEMIAPIKERLPESVLIREKNISPGGYRAGDYDAIEFFTREGKLVSVGRQYMKEVETGFGESLGVTSLPKPREVWRREVSHYGWIIYGDEVIKMLKKVVEVLSEGKEVLSVEEALAKKVTKGGDFEPAWPLVLL